MNVYCNLCKYITAYTVTASRQYVNRHLPMDYIAPMSISRLRSSDCLFASAPPRLHSPLCLCKRSSVPLCLCTFLLRHICASMSLLLCASTSPLLRAFLPPCTRVSVLPCPRACVPPSFCACALLCLCLYVTLCLCIFF